MVTPSVPCSLRLVLLAFVAGATTGCLDREPLAPGGSDAEARVQVALPGGGGVGLWHEGVTRWDAPQWSMSDEELRDLVAAAEGRVVIGFKDPGTAAGVDERGTRLVSDSSVAAGEAFIASLAGQVLQRFQIIPAVHAQIDPEDVSDIRRHPVVDYLEPDVPKYRTLSPRRLAAARGPSVAGPSGTSTEDTTWAVERIQAPEAWAQTTGSGVAVMVLDTGIESGHPDLDPVDVLACDGSGGGAGNAHGTHVSGMIAALSNGVGVIGAAHGVDLASVRLAGTVDFSHSRVLCGLQEAMSWSKGAIRVVNMSFGSDEGPDASVADAVNQAYSQGILLVAGVGNEKHSSVTFPASMGAVIGAVGIDEQDTVDSEMPSGPQVELAAPGVQSSIKTTCLNESYCLAEADTTGGSGDDGICLEPHEENCVHGGASSYATAFVSAAAALLMSYNSSWSNLDVRHRLRASAKDLGTPGRNDEYGYGLVQVEDALNYQMPPPPEVTIQGPLEIQPEATCTWNAAVTGGHAPLAYQWSVNHTSVGTDDHYTGGNPSGNTNEYFQLKVVVSDYVGRTDDHSVTVELDAGAPFCII